MFSRNNSAYSSVLTGWQDQPNIRGTYDILRSCLGTIALLCWSSACPNVPGLHCGRFARIREKLGLFVMAILLPEFVLLVAFGQLNDAWEDKNAFKAQNSSGWGLRQCYFVNMGGLFIRFAQTQSTEAEQQRPQQTFPVNCKQLRYLVDMSYIELLPIKSEDIEMRNKSDGITRAITIAQVLWFTISTLTRVAQNLYITTLELTTLSLVLIMVVSALAWWSKPMDVSHPVILQCQVPLPTVLAEMTRHPNIRSQTYGFTPLSFYDRREWLPSRIWASYFNLLRLLHRGFRASPPAASTINGGFLNSFPSTELHVMSFSWEVLPGVLTLAYSSIFMLAWDAYFPTKTERILWRVSSVICVVYGVLGAVITMLDRHGAAVSRWCRDVWRRVHERSRRTSNGTVITEAVTATDKKSLSTLTSIWRKFQRTCRPPEWLRRMPNQSAGNDPNLDIELGTWILATLLTMIYCFSRAYILIEDFISLRRQPFNTYQTVDWGRYSILF